MYSYEQRKKAVELYFQYNHSISAVVTELGYPKSRTSLKYWVREFKNLRKLIKSMKK